jgi:RNA polymerase sigma-70 factor (ECF subfamily)
VAAVVQDTQEPRLSRIQTFWSIVRQAQDGPCEAMTAAQQELLGRYAKAVKRYLLGALRDPEAADDLTQEFALRFLQGGFRGADAQRGRFRDFVRGVLAHLIADYHRRQKRQPQLLAAVQETAAPENVDADRQFLEGWRAELLDRAWKALASHQEQTGQLYFSVLRFRAEHPEMRSGPMAEQLSSTLGRPVTAVWVRQMLHRGREKFSQFLVMEVLHTLHEPTPEQLHEELVDLGLLDYCRPVLASVNRSSERASDVPTAQARRETD